MVSFHYSRIVLLLLFWQCYAQPFPNPSACSTEANPWATNLVNADGQDPCQVHQQLKGLGFSISCCFNQQDLTSVGPSNCGPCNQQSYNLLGACIACVFAKSQENSDLQSLQPPPPFSPDHFPVLSEWTKGDRKDPLPAQLVLPPWINIPPVTSGGIFDLQSAIAMGSKSLALPQAFAPASPAPAAPTATPPVLPASATPPVIPPVASSGNATTNGPISLISPPAIPTKLPNSPTTLSTSTLLNTNGPTNSPSPSSLGSPAISPTAITPLSNGKSSSGPTPSSSSGGISSGASKHSNAGAIAGAVIGALFALGIVFGAFFIFRRRRRARIPPSAQFLTVAGPGLTWRSPINIGDIDSPPPFTQGAWKDLPPEKVEARYY